MKKIQSFLIAKFQSSRLRESNYKIKNITLNELRRNNEIIRLSDNQILRTLRKVINKPFSQEELDNLLKLRKKLSKENNKQKLSEVIQKIDDILYVPEIISIHIENKSHYQKIIKDGVFINSHRFVRLWAGAGMLRKNIVNFVRQDLKDKIVEIIDNGRNKEIPLVSAKYSAYFSLAGTSSIPVSFPNICVIPDKIVERDTKVNFVFGEGKETNVEEKIMPIKFNLFDGQGIMSEEYAEKISQELGLDYILSWAICRGSFVKGLLVNFDFKKYNIFNGNQKYVKDIYGNDIEINKIDVFLGESQFKLWNCYNSTEEYVENCKKNNLLFGVSRISPSEKDEKKHVFSNYQFTQILNDSMSDEDLESFCKPTVDYLKDLSGFDKNKMLLYLLGNNINNVDKDYFFDSIEDNISKALMIDDVSKDPYVIQRFSNSLNRTIKDAYMGRTLHSGNFSMMISDVVAQIQHILGLEVKGILNKGEYYSNFWKQKNVNKVVGFRAPCVHSSENVVMPLVDNKDLNYWFSNISNGIIFPIDGNHTLLLGGQDWDGDILMATDQKEFIENVSIGLSPIYYQESKAAKEIVTDQSLFRADSLAFNTKVGFITNVSSSIWTLLNKFEINSKEHIELSKRLIYLRREQGFCVDGCKGIVVSKFPEHWVRYEKQDFSKSEEERNQVEFFNRLVVKKRPLFFINLYSHYNKRYQKELKAYDFYSRVKFGLSWDELLLKDDKTNEEKKIIDSYHNKSFFIHEKSLMNRLMWKMKEKVKEIKGMFKNNFAVNIYMSGKFQFDENKYNQLKELYKEYNVMKKSVKIDGYSNNDISFDDFDQCVEYLRNKCLEIGSEIELCDLALKLVYIDNKNGNKNFVWSLFGNQIIDNLLEKSHNKINVPYLKDDGEIQYLWQNYSLKEILLENN